MYSFTVYGKCLIQDLAYYHLDMVLPSCVSTKYNMAKKCIYIYIERDQYVYNVAQKELV